MSWHNKFKAVISVYLLLFNDEGELLLLKRQNTGFKDGEWGLPAGHVDGEEEIMHAMAREAKEEVGIDLDPTELTLSHVMHRNCGDHERVDFFITSQSWRGTVVNGEPEKCSELMWASLDNLPDGVINYYQQAFNKIRLGEVYSGFGW